MFDRKKRQRGETRILKEGKKRERDASCSVRGQFRGNFGFVYLASCSNQLVKIAELKNLAWARQISSRAAQRRLARSVRSGGRSPTPDELRFIIPVIGARGEVARTAFDQFAARVFAAFGRIKEIAEEGGHVSMSWDDARLLMLCFGDRPGR